MIHSQKRFLQINLLASAFLSISVLGGCNKKKDKDSVGNFTSVGVTLPKLLEYSVDTAKGELTLPTGSTNELNPDGFANSKAEIASAIKSGCKYDVPAGTYKITAEGSTITSIKGLDPIIGAPDPTRVIAFAGNSGEVTLSETAHQKFVLTFVFTGPAIVLGCNYLTR